MMRSTQRQLLDEVNQAFNDHDVETMIQLMTEDCTFENTSPPPEGTLCSDSAAVRAFWESFFAASPAAKIEIEEMFGEGDRLCQRWMYSWQGEQPGNLRGVDVLHVRDGKAAKNFPMPRGEAASLSQASVGSRVKLVEQ